MLRQAKPIVLRLMLQPCLLVSSLLVMSIAVQASAEVQNNVDQLMKTNSCVACDLQGADLNRMDLTGADLRDANLSNASLYLVNLSNADLRGAKLRDAKLGGADLANADLRGADLQGAILSGAYLVGTKMDEGWQKEEAELAVMEESESSPTLSSAPEPTQEIKQEPVDQPVDAPAVATDMETIPSPSSEAPAEKRVDPLPPASLEQTESAVQPKEEGISETSPTAAAAVIPAAVEKPELLDTAEAADEVSVEDTAEQTEGAALVRLLETGRCYQCDFAGVDLQDRNLDDVDIEQSDFSGATLRNTRFRGANLKGVSFRKADLRGADLRKADLYKADFSGADLTDTTFEDALLDEAIFEGSVGYQPPGRSE